MSGKVLHYVPVIGPLMLGVHHEMQNLRVGSLAYSQRVHLWNSHQKDVQQVAIRNAFTHTALTAICAASRLARVVPPAALWVLGACAVLSAIHAVVCSRLGFIDKAYSCDKALH